MSTFGILAFIIMPVLGGFIAWAGDVIGYRLGKSRRSLFGLRPRSTARLVGVGVGVILPLLSLGLAMLASNDAKVALLHLDALRQEQNSLQQQNGQLKTQNDSLRTAIAQAQEEAVRSARHSAQLRISLRATGQELTRADERLHTATRSLTAAQRSVADLRLKRDTLLRAQASLGQEVKFLTDKSRALTGDVSALKTKLDAARVDLASVNNALATTTAALNASQADLDRQREALGSPIIYESGQELKRWLVQVGDTQEQTETQLLQALVAASTVASASGAEAGPNGLAVRLVKGLPPTATFASERAAITSTAGVLQEAGKRKFVVIVRATRRLHLGEHAQAQVEFYALPYVIAFPKGEIITSVVIDGSQPRAGIFNELWNLVTKLVRREAQKSGLLRDPDTGQYGQLPANQILEALDAVAAAGGPVSVRVRAERDTYITDPLVIRIEVGDRER